MGRATPTRLLRLWAAALFCPLIVLLLGAGSENLSVFDTVSPPGDAIRDLFYLVFGITGGIFLAVEGMLVYCIIRFREKPNSDRHEPPQIYGSRPIELAWTVAPLLIVFVLFLVTVRSVAEVKRGHIPDGSMRVIVVGHQWWWEYQYPGSGIPEGAIGEEAKLGVVTANELHVPVGQPVYLELKSVDVIHSFWVPRLAGKTDVVPGRTNNMWFQANEPGLYLGQCAEYCGNQHANMMIRVYADEPDKYQQWLAAQKKKGADVAAAREGRDLFLSQACLNCHRVRGTLAKGTFGPDLTHLMSRKTLVTGMVPNNGKDLEDWLKDPQKIKPGCLMPDMHLSGSEVDRLQKYLLSLD